MEKWVKNYSLTTTMKNRKVDRAYWKTHTVEQYLEEKLHFRWDGRTLQELIEEGQAAAAESGKPLFNHLDAAAFWVKAFSGAHLSTDYYILTPEGGSTMSPQIGARGNPVSFNFMADGTTAKGLALILDDSIDTLYEAIGNQNKVRSFYNNLYDPSNRGMTTIDTPEFRSLSEDKIMIWSLFL